MKYFLLLLMMPESESSRYFYTHVLVDLLRTDYVAAI